MSTTLTQPGSVTVKQNSKSTTLDTSGTITATGSYFTNTMNVTTSSWQPIVTSSVNPIRYGIFTNNSTTVSGSYIYLGLGTQNTSSILYPNDSAIIPHNSAI